MDESLFERKFWCSTGDVTDIADFVPKISITRECIINYLLSTMAPFTRVLTASPLETTFRIIKWDVGSHFLRPAFCDFINCLIYVQNKCVANPSTKCTNCVYICAIDF